MKKIKLCFVCLPLDCLPLELLSKALSAGISSEVLLGLPNKDPDICIMV